MSKPWERDWNQSSGKPWERDWGGDQQTQVQAQVQPMVQDNLSPIAKQLRGLLPIPGFAHGVDATAKAGQMIGGGLQAIADKSAQFGPMGSIVGVPALMAKELIPQSPGDIAGLVAGGPVMEAIGGAAAKVGGKVLPKLSSALTSIEEPIVQRALARAGQVGNKLKQIAQTDMQFVTDSAINKLKSAVTNAREFLGKKLGDVEKEISAKSLSKIIHPQDIGEKLKLDLANAKYKVPGFHHGDVNLELPEKVTEIIRDFENLQGGKAAKATGLLDASGNPLVTPGVAPKPQGLSFSDAYALRKKIDKVVNFRKEGSIAVGSDVEAILKDARNQLNDRLYQAEPAFKEANDQFSKMAKVYDFLERRILNGENQTITNRVAKLLKKGSVQRSVIDRLDAMGSATSAAFDSLLDTVTAGRYDPRIHPSMGKAFFNTGGGIVPNIAKAVGLIGGGVGYAEHSPMTAAVTAAGSAAATSPRLHFRVIQASSKIAKALAQVGLTPAAQAAMGISAEEIQRAIVDQAMDQHLDANSNPKS